MDTIKIPICLTRREVIEILENVLNKIDPDPIHKKILMGLGLIKEVKGSGGRTIFPTRKVSHGDGFADDYEVLSIDIDRHITKTHEELVNQAKELKQLSSEIQIGINNHIEKQLDCVIKRR